MGWEQRKNGTYYYTAERSGGRVVKRYVGTGRAAELVAHLERIERQERETQEGMDRAVREKLNELDAIMNPLNELADALATAAMIAAGYHRHHRGPWRKRRA